MQPPSSLSSPRAALSLLLALTFLGLHPPSAAPADTASLPGEARLRPSGLEGGIVLVGPDTPLAGPVVRFVEPAGKEAGDLVVLALGDASPEPVQGALKDAKKAASLRKVKTRAQAEDTATLAALKKAAGVWLVADGDPGEAADLLRGTGTAKELLALRLRGGVVAGSGSAAAPLGRRFLGADGKPAEGLGVLPGTFVDVRVGKEAGAKALLGALKKADGLLGVRVGPGGALVVRGRAVRSAGEQPVTLCMAASEGREARVVELKPGAQADYNEMRRAALARSQPPYPPKELPAPEVPKGALVIVGGGGMPAEVARKFIELGGGPDGFFVVLPTSQPDPIPAEREAAFLKKFGAKNVVVLRGREREDVEDPKSLEALKKATGIWFGGGRQWRFVDAYEGTKAHELFRDVLRRGGVIGGSSAGATIQGDYLVRGAPGGPHVMMCEGYERALGFLPGVAIDQHFAQRKRFADMTALMKAYPQFLGIGLDEATAIVVRGHVAEVMGKGNAHFYDRRKPVAEGKPDHESLKAGDRYDLKARRALPAEKEGEKKGKAE